MINRLCTLYVLISIVTIEYYYKVNTKDTTEYVHEVQITLDKQSTEIAETYIANTQKTLYDTLKIEKDINETNSSNPINIVFDKLHKLEN
jgi:hypothetical protein